MMLRRLSRSEAALGFASRAIGLYLAFTFRTTRWRLDLHPDAAAAIGRGAAIVAFWHEGLAAMPMLFRLRPDVAGAPVHVLISRHRDGRLIADVVARFGLRVIEGSSSGMKAGQRTERGGGAAYRRLAGVLATGAFAVVTPDGPRGPRRRPAPGLGRLAAITGAPILPCAVATTRRVVLPTWDRLPLPLPFGSGVVVVGAPLVIGRADAAGADGAIAAALDAASARADGSAP